MQSVRKVCASSNAVSAGPTRVCCEMSERVARGGFSDSKLVV
jgi:hypothetical protein